MKVLFMCTANSCRSVLSEGLFNHLAPSGFVGISSGSFPSGQLNPRAVSTLQALGIDTTDLCSKGSEVFSDSPPDLVITVCNKAGGEPCPVYFGPAVKSHWGLADPSDVEGTDGEIQAAFDATVDHIRKRFEAFFSLDHSALTPLELKRELDRIGDL
ncbi:arsenate reductase ArsC [Pseudomonas syringae pv. aptata]|uniref:Low molecular weight phosphotyrosine protein phosphatase n=1 Tax=Pseudomonas syringae pv. japonica str. M301072 TaxID=629262 RepID=F3FIP4_PSESX|nr:arsenate reductase ArsC [Pseudomonas syringae]EGH30080.1 low molecular weight phosphotyrosine protein phosphatase [Pseudomonas syringae pv. japonica str. M301072]EPF69161.1 Arsenate reductase [Pseudomonas syringae pv. syringae SM]KZL36033.1 ArsC family transcriptional regulator [Pseudomonas syringae pv. syringae]MBI6707930.1 arsenate reductase ArsC [Pseudomonas syringae]MBI6815865.1 arsenate reductase ArsC [Pseudomonas syringae]